MQALSLVGLRSDFALYGVRSICCYCDMVCVLLDVKLL